jgi:phosphoribosylanthranilate isomerase
MNLMRPIVKICGLMSAQDVQTCVDCGVDIIGFVVDYPHQVPWNISVTSARQLIDRVSPPTETCVVTGGSPEKILEIVKETQPDYVQLHNNESLEDVASIIKHLRREKTRVIKVLFPDMPDIEKAAVEFASIGVDALLLDARTPDNATESGTINPRLYKKLESLIECPVILAGGITPENVTEIVSRTNAPIIDIMTGVEQCPGKKDMGRIRALMRDMQ